MPDLLIVYATTHGQTARIASRIAEAATEAGASVEVHDVAAGDVDPAGHDAVVAGGSVHAGHHQRALVEWANRHSAALAAVPSSFFSVSLSAAEDGPEAREANRSHLARFAKETGWTPSSTAVFAGALRYREYDLATRLVMRLVMRRGGRPTDTSRDHEYTDWEAVRRYGRDCAALAGARAVPA